MTSSLNKPYLSVVFEKSIGLEHIIISEVIKVLSPNNYMSVDPIINIENDNRNYLVILNTVEISDEENLFSLCVFILRFSKYFSVYTSTNEKKFRRNHICFIKS